MIRLRSHFPAMIASLAAGVMCGVHLAEAGTVSWGTGAGDTLQQSDGATALDATFTFELGVFINDFDPGAGNTGLWDTNWRIFDQATDANDGFNPTAGFVSRTPVIENGGNTNVSPFDAVGHDFRDSQPFIWVYNDKDGDADSEWALFTDASWEFPAIVNETDATLNFRLAGTNTAVFGQVAANFIETAAVPEPTSSMLLLVAAGAGLFVRRRR